MAGVRIGVTATRRSTQLSDALTRAGAEVVQGPMIAGDVPVDDAVIAKATRTILDRDPPWLVATTGVGMALWYEAADRSGLGEDLRALVRRAKGISRGAKPLAGFSAVGVKPHWASTAGTDRDVAAWIRENVPTDEPIGVQLHGGRTKAYADLDDDGFELLSVLPYTSPLPEDRAPAHALIRDLAAGNLDVITFTSPAAARHLMAMAAELGSEVEAAVREQLRGPTAVASIGAVTSEALDEIGAQVAITPERHRTADLIRAIQRWVDGRP